MAMEGRHINPAALLTPNRLHINPAALLTPTRLHISLRAATHNNTPAGYKEFRSSGAVMIRIRPFIIRVPHLILNRHTSKLSLGWLRVFRCPPARRLSSNNRPSHVLSATTNTDPAAGTVDGVTDRTVKSFTPFSK